VKICYLLPDRGIPLDGTKGASAHVRGLVRAWVELGHDITVIAAAPAASPDRVVPGARFHPLVSSGMNQLALASIEPRIARALLHLWNNVGAHEALCSALGSAAFDCVYERLSPFGIAGSLVAREHGLFHVLEVNAPLAWEGARFRNQAFAEEAARLEREALSHASLVLTVSSELKQLLVTGGLAAENIAVVPNGVDTELFRPDGLSERNGFGDRIVVGFVGSLKPWHGIDVLAQAFTELAQDPRFHLFVLGSGPEARRISSLAEHYPGRVTLKDGIPHHDVPRHLRAMDIAVAPYPALEPFYFSPLKVLEYMAAGRAIVASKAGQISELIRDGQTGTLVEPGNASQLAEAIRRLGADPALRQSLGSKAREEALRSHRWTDRAMRITELIKAEVAC
jgi:glycosyltransferase involved in cell wall biosynthesis